MALPACGHTHRPFGLLVCPRCLLVSGRFLFPGEVSPGAPSAGGGAERRGRGGRSAELRCPRCRPVTPRGLWPELRALLGEPSRKVCGALSRRFSESPVAVCGVSEAGTVGTRAGRQEGRSHLQPPAGGSREGGHPRGAPSPPPPVPEQERWGCLGWLLRWGRSRENSPLGWFSYGFPH